MASSRVRVGSTYGASSAWQIRLKVYVYWVYFVRLAITHLQISHWMRFVWIWAIASCQHSLMCALSSTTQKTNRNYKHEMSETIIKIKHLFSNEYCNCTRQNITFITDFVVDSLAKLHKNPNCYFGQTQKERGN